MINSSYGADSYLWCVLQPCKQLLPNPSIKWDWYICCWNLATCTQNLWKWMTRSQIQCSICRWSIKCSLQDNHHLVHGWIFVLSIQCRRTIVVGGKWSYRMDRVRIIWHPWLSSWLRWWCIFIWPDWLFVWLWLCLLMANVLACYLESIVTGSWRSTTYVCV